MMKQIILAGIISHAYCRPNQSLQSDSSRMIKTVNTNRKAENREELQLFPIGKCHVNVIDSRNIRRRLFMNFHEYFCLFGFVCFNNGRASH